MRATARIAEVARNTVDKLLVELGAACSAPQDRTLRNLTSQHIQVDEIWAFCYAKQKNVKPEHFEDGGYAGDIWTWAATPEVQPNSTHLHCAASPHCNHEYSQPKVVPKVSP